jgi:magnesium transporter
MAGIQDHRGLGLTRALKTVTRILGTAPRSPRTEHDNEHNAIVDCGVYVRGHRTARTWDYEEALAVVRRTPHAFLWLGLHEPSDRQLGEIANTFGLHELPVEDALQGLQRPKIERYGAMTFAAIRTVQYVEHTELTETSEIVETGHVMMFLSSSFVITVRHGAPTELSSLRADLEAKPDLLTQGPWAVAHAIYDRIVDSYVVTAEQIEHDIDLLEDMVFSRDRQGPIQRIYQLKREVVEF